MPNHLCHFELMTTDPEQAKAFYGEVFDWKFDDLSIPGYTLINAGAEPTGGLFLKPDSAPSVCANVYFHVDDIDATLAKAAEKGATTLVGKTAIPNYGHFAIITDPQGIPIGLMQPGHD